MIGDYELPGDQWFVRYSGLSGTPLGLLNATTIDIPGVGRHTTPPGRFWGPAFNGADEEHGFTKGCCVGMDSQSDFECRANK